MKKDPDSLGDYLMLLHQESLPLPLSYNTMRRIVTLDGRWKPTGIHSRLVNLINHGLVKRVGKGQTVATDTGARRKKHVIRLDGLTGIKRKKETSLGLIT